ncbi:hypothetical protein EAE96_009055 [Botrytis aclada]|nr:hypothetical protein EAE96_009055 [Botrytis aclada]
MANNPLSPDSILHHMAEALPTHQKDDTDSDISSSYEAIALFSHACMIAVGFRLIGFAEGQENKAECAQLAPRLSSKWNSSFGSHSFLYAHSQSSMNYVVKIDRLGGKAEIRGIGLGDEKITRLEITAKDYISTSALPLRIPFTNDQEDRSNLESRLREIFVSPPRIADLASLFKINIIQRLIPSLQKEGYEDSQRGAGEGAGEASRVHDEREEAQARRNPLPNPINDPRLPAPARPYPYNDPLADPPRRPIPAGDFPPPGFDDELDLNRLRRADPRGTISPFNIGHDDLHPAGLGPNDPFPGSFTGGAGSRGLGGVGGMHPTFDDPLFAGQGQRLGGGRGGAFNPQAPPGARYDPLGPGDGPQRGGGGRPPNPFFGYGDGDFM